jgi:hypothetical protein
LLRAHRDYAYLLDKDNLVECAGLEEDKQAGSKLIIIPG